MNELENQTHTYEIRLAKWGIHLLDKPATLTITPEYLEVTRNDTTLFKANYAELTAAGFNSGNGYWDFATSDRRKFMFQTHGALSFANWKIRGTDVNERLNAYLDAKGVPSALGYPHRVITKSTATSDARVKRILDWVKALFGKSSGEHQ